MCCVEYIFKKIISTSQLFLNSSYSKTKIQLLATVLFSLDSYLSLQKSAVFIEFINTNSVVINKSKF